MAALKQRALSKYCAYAALSPNRMWGKGSNVRFHEGIAKKKMQGLCHLVGGRDRFVEASILCQLGSFLATRRSRPSERLHIGAMAMVGASCSTRARASDRFCKAQPTGAMFQGCQVARRKQTQRSTSPRLSVAPSKLEAEQTASSTLVSAWLALQLALSRLANVHESFRVVRNIEEDREGRW